MRPHLQATAALASLLLTTQLHAHRTDGLLQSALVDVQADRVSVQVVLLLGMDVSPQFAALLDANRDGSVADTEKSAWTQTFLAAQSITVDGIAQPLTHRVTQLPPVTEMTAAPDGHAEVRIVFTAETGLIAQGPHTITHRNAYAPLPSTYQTHGIIPKTPRVSISTHTRDQPEQQITLHAVFTPDNSSTKPPHAALPAHPPLTNLMWLIGIAIAGTCLILAFTAFSTPRNSNAPANQ